MFRELLRQNKKLSMEECIHILKTETRGVLSVLGDNDYPYGMPMNHWYNEADGNIYSRCQGQYESNLTLFGLKQLDALEKVEKYLVELIKICLAVNIDVAYTVCVSHDGYPGVVHDIPYKGIGASGDD